jgi:hypothetical protein
MISADVQAQLDPYFDALEQGFREGIEEEIDFDGRWKPDRDQLMRMPVTAEAQEIIATLNLDPLAIDPLGADFENEQIRGLAVKKVTGQHSRILVQAFSNLQRLSRRWALTLHGDVFNRLTQPTFAIDAQIHLLIENGFIKFKSYNMAKRVLDLTGAYKEATDEDIQELFAHPNIGGDVNAVIASATPLLRKLISSVKDSQVFNDNTADELHAKAAAVNFDLPVQSGQVVLPSNNRELRKVLTFLDHGVYLSPLSHERYITNSRRRLI